MMIGPAIYQRLITDSAVTALLGTDPTRIYPNDIKEPDKFDAAGRALFPQASYTVKNPQFDVTYTHNSGLVYVDVEIMVAGLTYISCEQTAQAILSSIDQQGGTWGGTVVSAVFFEQWEDSTIIEPDTQAIMYYLKEMTFNVVYYLS
jgi:hypothetical protein